MDKRDTISPYLGATGLYGMSEIWVLQDCITMAWVRAESARCER